MNKRGISSQLQSKVRKFLDYMEHKESESPDKGLNILNTISKKLREEVQREFYGKILNNIKIFKLNFSPELMYDLSLIMKETVYGPNEVIFS